jgi:DNA-binding NarL/FixJ family response regulator
MAESIRLILIEDHQMVRAGFRMLLESQPDFQIVGEASSGEEGLTLAASLHPDVVLLDISMPGIGGAETARLLKEQHPDIAILVVTIHTSEAYLLELLDKGVEGYLPKHAAAEELIRAVRQVYAGKSYLHASLVDTLVKGYRNTQEGADSKPELTARQKEVLQLVATGLTSQEVGKKLGLSARTIDRHIENMLKRLGLRSRIELVSYAIREGLIEG